MQKIEISHRTIIFTVIFLLILKFLWIVKELIFSLFIAFIIMSALKPSVIFLAKRKIPRSLATVIIYLLFLSFFIFIFTIAIPPLVMESSNLIRSLPAILQNLSPNFRNILDTSSLTNYLPNITNQFLDIFKGIFSNAVFTISTLFFSFYFLLEEDLIKKTLGQFTEEDSVTKIVGIFSRAEDRMSAWFWGEIVLMSVVGIMTFVGLNLIGMKYVLALAVLAGLLEAIPNIGPILSAVPAVIIGFSHSYFLGFSALVLYFIVQQLENNLIVPWVMKKAVGLNPIITLIALIVGGKLAGVLGVLLAIPTTLFLETVLMEIIKPKPTEKII